MESGKILLNDLRSRNLIGNPFGQETMGKLENIESFKDLVLLVLDLGYRLPTNVQNEAEVLDYVIIEYVFNSKHHVAMSRIFKTMLIVNPIYLFVLFVHGEGSYLSAVTFLMLLFQSYFMPKENNKYIKSKILNKELLFNKSLNKNLFPCKLQIK